MIKYNKKTFTARCNRFYDCYYFNKINDHKYISYKKINNFTNYVIQYEFMFM